MTAAVSDHRKMRRVAGFGEHGRRVAAYGHRPPRLEKVVVVECEGMGMMGDAAMIAGDLPVILAAVLERQFEGADRQREEGDRSQAFRQFRILDGHRPRAHHPVVETAERGQQTAEILHIKRSAQAFADKHRIFGQFRRQPATGENGRSVS